MPDIGGIPYVDSSDLVSGWPTVSQSVAQEVSDQLASKLDTTVTTKGDLITYGTDVARLGVGSNGQVLTADSGETLGVKWADATGGLTLITSATGSGVSSVSVNDCFTSSFEAYRIVISSLTPSTSGDLYLRWRNAGADYTGGVYENAHARIVNNGNFAAWYTNGGDTKHAVGQINNFRSPDAGTIDVFMPQQTARTRSIMDFSGDVSGAGGTARSFGSGTYISTTTVTGFTLYPASGTFSLNIRVYAYES